MIDGETATCCNVSSWYVDPEFRNYAALFASMTQKRKDVTYFNVTPAFPTWPILEAQGFKTYCRGLYFSLPVLSRGGRDMRVEAVTPETASIAGLPDDELGDAQAPCRLWLPRLVCRTAGEAIPFHFLPVAKAPRHHSPARPSARLLSQIADYVDARARSGATCCGAAARSSSSMRTARSRDLPGLYSEVRGRKYFKGPHEPRLGDLADTELAIFGM